MMLCFPGWTERSLKYLNYQMSWGEREKQGIQIHDGCVGSQLLFGCHFNVIPYDVQEFTNDA